jgi:hypothetical protein
MRDAAAPTKALTTMPTQLLITRAVYPAGVDLSRKPRDKRHLGYETHQACERWVKVSRWNVLQVHATFNVIRHCCETR